MLCRWDRMKINNQSRKKRRKTEQSKRKTKQIVKKTSMIGSALMITSVAAPVFLNPLAVHAEHPTNKPTIQSREEITSQTSSPSNVTETTKEQKNSSDVEKQPMENTTTENTTTENQTSETESKVVEDNSVKNSNDTSQTTSSSDSNVPETSKAPTQENQLAEENSKATESPATKGIEATTGTEKAGKPVDFAQNFSIFPANVDPSAYINEISAYAKPVADANDLYASVMIAQAILESGWGSSALSQAPNYNLFGIKGNYQGQSVYMDTWEYINGQWVVKKEPFRKYPSFRESFADNAYVLKNTSFQAGVYYYSGAWKSNTKSYQDATAWLTGRYATDPTYNTKLNNLITNYNLTKYDTTSGTKPNPPSGNTGNNGNTGGASKQDTYHTVVAGDSLWALSMKYGTSIATIKSWNHLSGDTIYIGQRLLVKKGSSNSGNNGNPKPNPKPNPDNTGNTTTTYYTVRAGDSLWAIANKYGISVANLRQWNAIQGDLIYPGQRLIVKKGNSNSGNNGNSTPNSGNNGNAATTYYTVRGGDSLWAIANRYGISVANLRQWNAIQGDLIYPGQRLIVKKGNSAGSNAGNSGNHSSNKTYTVVSGDSLWGIAMKYGTSVQRLKQLNNLTGDIIYIGQVLKVS